MHRRVVLLLTIGVIITLLSNCTKKGDQITNNYYSETEQADVRIISPSHNDTVRLITPITISFPESIAASALKVQIYDGFVDKTPWLSAYYSPDSGTQQSITASFSIDNAKWVLWAAVVTTAKDTFWSPVMHVYVCDSCN
jgi:hypothetical protein